MGELGMRTLWLLLVDCFSGVAVVLCPRGREFSFSVTVELDGFHVPLTATHLMGGTTLVEHGDGVLVAEMAGHQSAEEIRIGLPLIHEMNGRNGEYHPWSQDEPY